MVKKSIEFFFDPKSVAVVGASEAPGKLSSVIIDSLISSGFPGRVVPVNPKYSSVRGLKCFPSVSEIENGVDLAVYVLPSARTPEALRDSAGKTRGAVIVSGGFGETGEAGKGLEREIKDIAKETGIRVIGPNCMGIYDAISRLDTFFIPRTRISRPVAGGLSIISQSGSFAITAMDELAGEGVGVARVVSYGNKADVNEADCLRFLAEDEHTKAVAVYIEAISDGRAFIEAASFCASKKPVFAIKVGKRGAGALSALSHTGAIAGNYEAYRAAFRKSGVIELDGYEEFIAACKAFGAGSGASGPRVIIITDGGGMGVSLADACVEAGLEVPPLSEDLKERVQDGLPDYFSISNPVDLTGSVTDEMYADALEKTLSDDSFDIAIVAALWGPPGLTDELPSLISERSLAIKKPVLVCSPGGAFTKSKSALFRKLGFPVFQTPESAVKAASVLARSSLSRRGG